MVALARSDVNNRMNPLMAPSRLLLLLIIWRIHISPRKQGHTQYHEHKGNETVKPGMAVV